VGGPVCCGLVPHLELVRRPDLYGRPVAVGNWDGPVVTVSPEAASFGIRHGIPLRQAEKLCPQVEVFAPDPESSTRLREALSAALYDLAPQIQVRTDGCAFLDLAGSRDRGQAIREARRRLRAAAGIEPRLGLAPGPFSARLAAARARPGRLLQVRDAPSFLAPLPVAELDLEPELLDRLLLLGLKTLGAVALIGPRMLEGQLGPPGRPAVLCARGEEPEWLRPWSPPTITSAHRQFEPPVEDREALLFIGRALTDELALELGLRGAGAKRVRVRLATEAGPWEEQETLVRHPLSSGAELFGLVSGWLRSWEPAAPVTELLLELPELERAGRRQLRLWTGGDGSSEEVEAALERIQERYGDPAVVRPLPALTGSPVPAYRFEWVARGSAG
jgi:protein ImuB